MKIRFSYPKNKKNQPRGETVCLVSEDDGSLMGWGTARTYSGDNFSRVKGRKIALAKALASFPKSFRTEVWENYFKMCKK